MVDLYDAAWTWLADIGERRLVQVFAKPTTVTRLDRDRRLEALTGEAFSLMQELTHREGGAELLREALGRRPAIVDAAREALSAAPPAADVPRIREDTVPGNGECP
ncbi:MAG: hypothetical protein FD180_831 [Planctomycetota bacterium]|nr:MAG: hypothetical protein FD180_831 [Planctomycetota bacterium]